MRYLPDGGATARWLCPPPLTEPPAGGCSLGRPDSAAPAPARRRGSRRPRRPARRYEREGQRRARLRTRSNPGRARIEQIWRRPSSALPRAAGLKLPCSCLTLPRRPAGETCLRAVVLREEVERARRAMAEACGGRTETLESNNRDMTRFLPRHRRRPPDGPPARPAGVEGLAASHGIQPRAGATRPRRSRRGRPQPLPGHDAGDGNLPADRLVPGALERSPHFLTVDKVTLRQKAGSVANLASLPPAYFRGEEGALAD